jgi:hypothetical protein
LEDTSHRFDDVFSIDLGIVKMKKESFSRYLFLTGCLCMAIVLLSFKPNSFKTDASKKQRSPLVRSLVSKLEIVQSKMIGPNTLQVIMRNGYQKDITAVVASLGDEKTIRRDYIYAELERDQKLSPGAADEFLYSIDSSEEENIVIRCVLFSDMSREGDYKAAKSVLDKRQGVKIQLARFNAHLEQLNAHLQEPNKLDYARLQTESHNVRVFAENLPIKTDDDAPMSEALEFGLKHGRALILRYLAEMNDQLGDGKGLNLSNDKQDLPSRYEKFRNKSLRVEKDFKSLVSRL